MRGFVASAMQVTVISRCVEAEQQRRVLQRRRARHSESDSSSLYRARVTSNRSASLIDARSRISLTSMALANRDLRIHFPHWRPQKRRANAPHGPVLTARS